MKVVQVISGLSLGGAETQLAAICRGLSDRGHEVSVVCMGAPGAVAIDPRVAVHYLGMRKTPLSFVRGIFLMCKLLVCARPDVVHAHMVHANLASRLARVVHRARTINSVHSISETRSKILQWCYRLSNPLVSTVAFVSDASADAYVSRKLVPRGKAVVVHNGIDPEVFKFSAEARGRIRSSLGIPADVLVIVYVGRLVEGKNVDGVLRAARPLLVDGSASAVLVVGDGPLRKELEGCCDADSVLKSGVKFVGSVSDVAEYLSAGDVFVLLSKAEGFGLAVAEAMACERIVVATDCGGTREVLGDTPGLVPADAPDEAESAIRWALGLAPEDRERQGAAGRQRLCRNFSIGATVEHWERLYAR